MLTLLGVEHSWCMKINLSSHSIISLRPYRRSKWWHWRKMLYTIPAAHPTSSTQTQPDHASCALFSFSKHPSWRRLTICRCRIRSRDMSRSQSIVWKSSYWPMPGGRSSMVSIRLLEPGVAYNTAVSRLKNLLSGKQHYCVFMISNIDWFSVNKIIIGNTLQKAILVTQRYKNDWPISPLANI